MKLISFAPSIALLLLVTSCASYYLTTDSLRTQLAGIDSTQLKLVKVRGPMGEQYEYLANPINEIECVDKEGNPARLINSPSIEMRVTQTNGKKTIFYFDRIFVTDSTLHGMQSRFVSMDKTIKLKDITKIEVQDGRKGFDYISR